MSVFWKRLRSKIEDKLVSSNSIVFALHKNDSKQVVTHQAKTFTLVMLNSFQHLIGMELSLLADEILKQVQDDVKGGVEAFASNLVTMTTNKKVRCKIC